MNHDPSMYGDVPICGKFSTISSYFTEQPFHLTIHPSARCYFQQLTDNGNLDMASLGGGALVKRYIWLATCLPRYPYSQISIAKGQTISPAIKRQPRLGNYEALSRTSAAPRGRTYRSSLLLGQCRYWRRRRIYPQHRLPSKD